MKGLTVDLVIWNEDHRVTGRLCRTRSSADRRQRLKRRCSTSRAVSSSAAASKCPKRIAILLQTVARVIF